MEKIKLEAFNDALLASFADRSVTVEQYENGDVFFTFKRPKVESDKVGSVNLGSVGCTTTEQNNYSFLRLSPEEFTSIAAFHHALFLEPLEVTIEAKIKAENEKSEGNTDGVRESDVAEEASQS